MAASKLLLLDFDGVIFKNNKMHNVVSQRCEYFVNKYIKTSIPSKINKQLYQSTGHTLLGLKKLGIKPIPTIDEFNDYVYKDIFKDFNHKTFLDSIDEKQKKELTILKKISKTNPPYIFSNAPDIWTNTITEILLDTVFPTTTSITSPYIKPNKIAYIKIENHLKDNSFVFIDDKIQNLPFVSSKWTRVWLNDEDNLKISEDFYFIKSLEELVDNHLIL
jgi:FMN phosphatase YigB (HAD superfamily)